jgi:pimeloyl-ACP methyl ester carboxylesterase
MKSQEVEVEGIGMRWEEAGEGAAVVFVHGIPTSPALWRRVVPMVAGARCLAWEMVGYGRSIGEGNGRDISVARQAGYLHAWLDAIGVGEVVLVGTTWVAASPRSRPWSGRSAAPASCWSIRSPTTRGPSRA